VDWREGVSTVKTLEISKATNSLAHYAKAVRRGPMVLTSRGRPVAALVSVLEMDRESLALCSNPEFMAMIEESRACQKAKGGIPLEEVRRKLGIKKTA
jgi:prevent-host-death family protein